MTENECQAAFVPNIFGDPEHPKVFQKHSFQTLVSQIFLCIGNSKVILSPEKKCKPMDILLHYTH